MPASPSAASSSSSVPYPETNFSSGSGYSTPLTSHVPTPAASVPTLGLAKTPVLKRGTRIEVHLPQVKQANQTNPAPHSHRALQQSIYSLKSKRKRVEIDDSEEDYDSDTSPDAKLARKLQDEEDKLVAAKVAARASPQHPSRRSTRHMAASARKAPVSFIKTKGKQAVSASKNKIRFGASDDEDEDEDGSMDEDEDEDEDEDDDVPIRQTARKLRHSTRSATKTTTSSAVTQDLAIHSTGLQSTLGKTLGKDLVHPDVDSDDYTHLSCADTPQLGIDMDSGSEFSVAGSESEAESAPDTDNASDNAGVNNGAAARPDPLGAQLPHQPHHGRTVAARRHQGHRGRKKGKAKQLEHHHPELLTMWDTLRDMPILTAGRAEQPKHISRQLKPFQLEGLAWMTEMEKIKWKGGILGDEMGLGKTIQAVSLIMSDWPAKQPTLVLVPPVAMMQWMAEINSYTEGTLNTLFFHGTNSKSKNLTIKDLKKYNVIIMSYNSLEAMFRKQEKGFKRKEGLYKEKSVMHQIHFHRVILDEAHSIKTRTTMTAKACFALNVTYRWCLSGTPLQNRIGEFFSLVRFLNVRPFASYFCKQCPCTTLEWTVDESYRCTQCKHAGMSHISLFNRELLNPIQKFGNRGPGAEALGKLRILTDRLMLRRLKKNHTNSMELPVKEIYVDRQFFGEEERDFASSIMTSGERRFNTYVSQGVLLNNYANIFGLIMQMRQVADHPDLILKKNSSGGQNVLSCCICDEPAEEAIRSRCKHDFCRSCARSYLLSSDQPDCPRCHIPLSIDLEQPEIEQDEDLVKKSSIINRINMENWTSSSKIELLVHELHKLRSDNASHKSIIFSQFTTMLQLIEWRLRRAGITTVMLDGSMTPGQRQASIEHFMKNVEVECFLVSLKAGGVALNLTEASRVFIVDPYVSPMHLCHLYLLFLSLSH